MLISPHSALSPHSKPALPTFGSHTKVVSVTSRESCARLVRAQLAKRGCSFATISSWRSSQGIWVPGVGLKQWFLHAFLDSFRPGGEKRKLYACSRLSWSASPPSAPVSRGERGFLPLPLEHLSNEHLNSMFTPFLCELRRF